MSKPILTEYFDYNIDKWMPAVEAKSAAEFATYLGGTHRFGQHYGVLTPSGYVIPISIFATLPDRLKIPELKQRIAEFLAEPETVQFLKEFQNASPVPTK